MNDTDMLQVLLVQITALDERTQASINKLSDKVDNLHESLNQVQLKLCPTPGMCTPIAKELAIIGSAIKAQEAIIDNHQSWIDKLDGKMVGIATAVGAVWSGVLVVLAYFYKISN